MSLSKASVSSKEYQATDSAGRDMLAALYKAKAAMDEHIERLKDYPEIEELLPWFKFVVQKIEEASKDVISAEVMREITEVMTNCISQVWCTYGSKEQRRLMCDQLGYDGFVQASVNYCKAIQKDGSLERNPETGNAVSTLMVNVAMLTDGSKMVCQFSEQGLIELLLNELKRQVILETTKTKVVDVLVENYLNVVYNCAKGGVSRQYFNDHGAVDIIMPYTKAKDNSTKALAVMAIAYILEEGEQNELIVADDSMIHYVLAMFSEAMDCSNKVSLESFSVEELAQGLGSLANHYVYKQIIVRHGALQLLVRLMKEGDDKETYWAIRCIRTLAFNDDNIKERIKKEPGAISTIQQLQSHDVQEVRQAAENVLYIIRRSETCPRHLSLSTTTH